MPLSEGYVAPEEETGSVGSPLEPPEELITLQRAAELSGLSERTLRAVSYGRRGKEPRLQTRRRGWSNRLTTRRWLHTYLSTRDATFKQATLLPDGYVAPDSGQTG
jgi:hypothetical protein